MSPRKLSRREFLVLGALGVAGGGVGLVAVGRSIGGASGLWWGGQTAVDPAPGDAFQDPTSLALKRPAPGIVEGALTVALTDTA
ncbi:MAG TPA: twin-arginine translocation signal domain-containing protein, partial [Thermoleophilia bacterium]|nr:twin-arginine translocation signal domain-containing protein [Thermoleophilia bacterium]